MALLSLGLGIGANTAIYSFMDAILVRTLPVHDPQSLVVMQWHSLTRPPVVRNINGSIYNEPGFGQVSPSFPNRVLEILADSPILSSVAGYYCTGRLTALIHGQSSAVDAMYVSGGFFGALGLPPAAGRLIGGDQWRAVRHRRSDAARFLRHTARHRARRLPAAPNGPAPSRGIRSSFRKPRLYAGIRFPATAEVKAEPSGTGKRKQCQIIEASGFAFWPSSPFRKTVLQKIRERSQNLPCRKRLGFP